jgi:SRSO17 transposase
MKKRDLRRLSTRLEKHLNDCFDGMGRSERREALGNYVRALLLDGERKSIEPMAERLAEDQSEVQAIRQRLQQAVTVAKWAEGDLYRRIAFKVDSHVPDVDAFVLDDTGFPKKGRHSVGVQRQYSGTMGRIDNCQVAASLHLASDLGGACVGMQLYLPRDWAEDPKLRMKAKIPDEIVFQEKWRIGLDLLDRALGWGLESRPVVADAGYGDSTKFRKGLEERGLSYVVGIGGSAVVWPPGTCPVQNPKPAGSKGRPRVRWDAPSGVTPLSIADLAESLDSKAFRRVTWKVGTKGKQWNRFAFVRIRTAHRHTQGKAPGEEQWLICEWPKSAKKPTTFYLSNLPPDTAKRRLVYLAKLRWRIERDYQEMKSELGLDHFEGRGWPGFQHHCACVAAAHAFLTIERVLFPPQRETAHAA